MKDRMELMFHHVGCLTSNIEETLLTYVEKLGFRKLSPVIPISSQQVKVCFIEMPGGGCIELIEPAGENKTLDKMLKSKNPYYHIGYFVDDLPTVLEQLQSEGFYLVNRFLSEAFENRECAFLYTSEMHLIELIERDHAV